MSDMFASIASLGSIMQTVQDPNFHAQVKAFVEAIADTRERTMRIEAKLDALLARDTSDAQYITAALAELGPAAVGGRAAATGTADDGAGSTPPASGSARNGSGTAGADRISGGVA